MQPVPCPTALASCWRSPSPTPPLVDATGMMERLRAVKTPVGRALLIKLEDTLAVTATGYELYGGEDLSRFRSGQNLMPELRARRLLPARRVAVAPQAFRRP